VSTENVAVGCASVVWLPVGAVAGTFVVCDAELPPCCVSEPVPAWPPPELGVACATPGEVEAVGLGDPLGDAVEPLDLLSSIGFAVAAEAAGACAAAEAAGIEDVVEAAGAGAVAAGCGWAVVWDGVALELVGSGVPAGAADGPVCPCVPVAWGAAAGSAVAGSAAVAGAAAAAVAGWREVALPAVTGLAGSVPVVGAVSSAAVPPALAEVAAAAAVAGAAAAASDSAAVSAADAADAEVLCGWLALAAEVSPEPEPA
jgi:hypothetical protein